MFLLKMFLLKIDPTIRKNVSSLYIGAKVILKDNLIIAMKL